MARTLDEKREAADELALVRRARDGERAAFDRLVARRFTGVYALLHRLTGSHEDAEDLAQECFVRAWLALEHYREEAAFGTWLARIALHLAQDHHRARARRERDVALEDLEAGAEGETRRPQEIAPGEQAVRGELIRDLALALDRLPPRLRAALVLRTLDGREYDDLARLLDVRATTARMQVMRARKLLARWLAPWLEEGGR